MAKGEGRPVFCRSGGTSQGTRDGMLLAAGGGGDLQLRRLRLLGKVLAPLPQQRSKSALKAVRRTLLLM